MDLKKIELEKKSMDLKNNLDLKKYITKKKHGS